MCGIIIQESFFNPLIVNNQGSIYISLENFLVLSKSFLNLAFYRIRCRVLSDKAELWGTFTYVTTYKDIISLLKCLIISKKKITKVHTGTIQHSC